MLKMTKIELELISDSDIYLFLMDTIRGGMTVCNKKFVKADNIYTRKKDENSDINKYLMYLDEIIYMVYQCQNHCHIRILNGQMK